MDALEKAKNVLYGRDERQYYSSMPFFLTSYYFLLLARAFRIPPGFQKYSLSCKVEAKAIRHPFSIQYGWPAHKTKFNPIEQDSKYSPSAGRTSRFRRKESLQNNRHCCDICIYRASSLLRGDPSLC